MANPAMEAASLIAKAAALPFSTLPSGRDCAIFLIIMTRLESPLIEPHGNRCVERYPRSGVDQLFADSADSESAKLNRGIRDRRRGEPGVARSPNLSQADVLSRRRPVRPAEQQAGKCKDRAERERREDRFFLKNPVRRDCQESEATRCMEPASRAQVPLP